MLFYPDTESDTNRMVPVYSMPVDTETSRAPDTSTAREIEIDTGSIDVYAMPLYAMQEK